MFYVYTNIKYAIVELECVPFYFYHSFNLTYYITKIKC